MEEWVGAIWDKWIKNLARTTYPQAVVELNQVQPGLQMLFRALGGDAGLGISASQASRHQGYRNWLQKISHTADRVELCWRNPQYLFLPQSLACFPERELNRQLYIWLVALSSQQSLETHWLLQQQRGIQQLLRQMPGLVPLFERLSQAILAQRTTLDRLPPRLHAAERAIRSVLQDPWQALSLPLPEASAFSELEVVPMLLHPAPPGQDLSMTSAKKNSVRQQQNQKKTDQLSQRRLAAKAIQMPDNPSPVMLLFRAESLFSWAEYVSVNRATDDDTDVGSAADDLDFLSIANDNRSSQRLYRFDLDLPAAAVDDLVLAEGLLYPEWDYRKQRLQENHCSVQVMLCRENQGMELPAHLRLPARKLQQRFARFQPQSIKLRQQTQGDEIDIDACVTYLCEQQARQVLDQPALYLNKRAASRDLSCMLLADLSMSTDAWINNDARIIDLIRDSLFLFCEALHVANDRFAVYGFSSVRRSHIRHHLIKGFDETYDGATRGRIQQVKPGYYTRMGAAIRHSCALLQKQKSRQRLLLLLTDGKPNDLDIYEGRYGIEDTRMAIVEARRLGLQVFCLTIDQQESQYLPYLFGQHNYYHLQNAEQLPQVLPRIYLQLRAQTP